LIACARAATVARMSDTEQFTQRLRALETRVRELESTAAIERLQNIYGYYLDNRMWNEVVGLFTEDAEVEVGRRGIYRGRAQLHTFFHEVLGFGRSGRRRDELHNHVQIQGVVTLAPEGDRAFGRFRALAQFAMTLPDGTPGHGWADGSYENEYALRDGAWRIHVLRWTPSFYGKLPAEAVDAGRPSAPPSKKHPPSAPSSYAQNEAGAWILPFHFPHPHTGQLTPIETEDSKRT
jgi:hypothetical protein